MLAAKGEKASGYISRIEAEMNDSDIEAGLTNLLNDYRDYRQEILEECKNHQHVIFYGCGAILKSIQESWKKHVGVPISYTCDSSPAKWGKTYADSRCISPSQLLEIRDDSIIFLTIGDFRPVYEDLKVKGFKSVKQLFKYDLDAADHIPREAPKELVAKLLETWALLADEKSRRVFCAIVNRVLGNESYINEMVDVQEGDQYFPADIMTLKNDEVLVDVGAYTGDTLLEFNKRTNGYFGAAICLELNRLNFEKLRITAQDINCNGEVITYNIGAWDEKAEVSYSLSESQSTLGCGEGRGYVEKLDTILSDWPATIIKMDIEGAEPNALQGAINTIKHGKPRLAISVYHDFRHLWQIPLLIKSMVPEYKIYLRHHTSLEYETVCYAIAGDA